MTSAPTTKLFLLRSPGTITGSALNVIGTALETDVHSFLVFYEIEHFSPHLNDHCISLYYPISATILPYHGFGECW
jgi:hypothetical protein